MPCPNSSCFWPIRNINLDGDWDRGERKLPNPVVSRAVGGLDVAGN